MAKANTTTQAFLKKIGFLHFYSNVKKNPLFFVVAGAILLGSLLFLVYGDRIFTKEDNPLPPTGIILFEGDNCPQCAKVDTFIKNNKVEAKIQFTTLEVFHNAANANIMADKSEICGLELSEIGVPFLWDGKNCILGYIDVIDFFKDAISHKKP